MVKTLKKEEEIWGLTTFSCSLTFTAGSKCWLAAQELENLLVFYPLIVLVWDFLQFRGSTSGLPWERHSCCPLIHVFHSPNAHERDLGMISDASDAFLL